MESFEKQNLRKLYNSTPITITTPDLEFQDRHIEKLTKLLNYGKYKNISIDKLRYVPSFSYIMGVIGYGAVEKLEKLKTEEQTILVDIKFTQEEKGTWPCIPGFHTDCTQNMLDPAPLDHLVIFNYSTKGHPSTEFANTYFDSIHIPRSININKSTNLKTTIYPNNTFVHYTRYNQHRGTFNKCDHTRLFIRFTLTSIYKHRNDQLRLLLDNTKQKPDLY